MAVATPIWQLSSNVYAASPLMAALRTEETRMVDQTPPVPMSRNPTPVMGVPQWFMNVEPSFEAIRRYVFPKHYFDFCQRYVAAAMTLKPSNSASARDKVLWMLDVYTHIANGFEALNLQFVPAHVGLDRGLVTDAWGDYSGYGAILREPMPSTRPIGMISPPVPKTFQRLSLSDPFYRYATEFIALLRDYGHAWPTVAQTQALYGQYVAAEAEAFRRGSYAPINNFAQLPQMRLIRSTSWFQFMAQGMTAGPLFWTPLSEQPGAGDKRKETVMGGPSGTQGAPYLPWVRGGSDPGFRQSLGSGALDGADHADWERAGAAGDWLYQRAQQQWRALGANGGTLAQFINGVHNDRPQLDQQGRGGVRLFTHNYAGNRVSLVPNFNFHYRYAPDAFVKSFRDMTYEDQVAGAIKRVLSGPTNSYTGSPLRLSHHDCELVLAGRAEFAKQAQAAFHSGVKQGGMAIAATISTLNPAPIIAWMGAVLTDPEQIFGPRAVGCPAYGGCPGAMEACSSGARGPFLRSLPTVGLNVIPDNSLPTTEMWFMFFIGIATNERVGAIDLGFDFCPEENVCIWSRAEAQALLSNPPPSLSAQRSPPPPPPPQGPSRAQMADFCQPLLDQFLATTPGLTLSPDERARVIELCEAEVFSTGRADEAVRYLEQIRATKALGLSLPPAPKGGGIVPIVVGAGVVAGAIALLGKR
jgi:hypothetical protein